MDVTVTLRTDVSLEGSGIFLGPTLRSVPAAAMEVDQQATADVMFVTVTLPEAGVSVEDLEEALRSDPTVARFRKSAGDGRRHIYAVVVEVDRRLMSEVAAELGINVLSVRSRPGDTGWTFELEIPDRESLVDLRQFWENHDAYFSLERLFTPGPADTGTSYGLSKVQMETLLVAFERGYFDVPREISQQELAEELGASPTAVSQRIRRGVTTLIANTVATER